MIQRERLTRTKHVTFMAISQARNESSQKADNNDEGPTLDDSVILSPFPLPYSPVEVYNYLVKPCSY